jgi:hypothetical protein
MRMAKVKSRAGLVGRLKHNTREFLTPNVDHDRSERNWTSGGDASAVMARYSQMLPDKVRKNAVHAVELLMTASPDGSRNWKQYLTDCDKWAADLFGKENVLSIAHHFDETTPHTQILVMPLKDGKLNAKHFIGGSRDRMTELQDDFFQKVGKAYGLERGKPRAETKARHTPHTLAGKAAELDEREKKLAGREVKFKEAADDFKRLMGMKPADVRELQNRLSDWENQTAAGLVAIANNLRSRGFRNTAELKQDEKNRQQRRSSSGFLR